MVTSIPATSANSTPTAICSIRDRKKDMVIVGGYNVYPREVDEVLFTHPAVKEAASTGAPDRYYGETVRAFVVLNDGARIAADELIDALQEKSGAVQSAIADLFGRRLAAHYGGQDRQAGAARTACFRGADVKRQRRGRIMAYKAEIPYGAYWSTPFARWQGAFANLHSARICRPSARKELARRGIDPANASTTACSASACRRRIRSTDCPGSPAGPGSAMSRGPTVMQACATGVRALLAATQEIEAGLCGAVAGRSPATAPRTARISTIPNPSGPGGTGAHEDWVMDNFSCDPLGGHAMLQTAENVAAQASDHHRRAARGGAAARGSNIAMRWPTAAPF